jgi:modification methylase
MIAPGSALFDDRRSHQAEVRIDGTLAVPGAQGSIHKLGALVQGRAACNGWMFWHYETAGRLAPIDRLRAEARVKLGLTSGETGEMLR